MKALLALSLQKWMEKVGQQMQSALRRRERRRERGQSYVEFVIALPLFMIMIAAVTWYGQALYTRLAVDAAHRTGW